MTNASAVNHFLACLLLSEASYISVAYAWAVGVGSRSEHYGSTCLVQRHDPDRRLWCQAPNCDPEFSNIIHALMCQWRIKQQDPLNDNNADRCGGL